ncbi:MAG TPA: DNA recombination/repair protein RecA, partial [Pedomonas sp.]
MSASLRVIEKDSMDKTRALEAALAQIDRAFGKGSVMKLGQRSSGVEIETIS